MLQTRSIVRYLFAIVLLTAFPADPLPAATQPTAPDGALKEIVEQIEADPELRVAGEPIFMPGDLIGFYRERNHAPLWRSADPAGREQIRTALAYFTASPGTGLCGADYHLPFFQELLSHFAIEEYDYGLPRLRWSGWYDILLTDALFHYAQHMIKGRVPENAIQEGWNLRKKQDNLARVVNYAFAHDELEKILHDFQPVHPGYIALQRALARYREIEAFGGWAPIPDGETLHEGIADERVALLRSRLLLSGDLEDFPEAGLTRMTAVDSAALKRFQNRHGLAADGVLGEQTLAALNVPVSARVRQIELNLERWRWLPKAVDDRYLLVNIADFSVSIVEKGRVVLSLPAVVGTRYRKTPVFSARLEYIEFAPYWYVPKTILVEDKLPLIRRDPSYLEANHYELVARDLSTPLDPAVIDWETVDGEDFPGLLRQKPGPWNALGRVKFMLPNPYAVYLHDTNERHLFWQRNRQFSSGCIRLKQPEALARYLLADASWDDEDIDTAMAGETPRRVYLKKPLPVHVLYWTAWVDEAGRVNFRDDVYGRDRDLLQAMQATPSGCTIHKTAAAFPVD